jgi:hypothetical protein
LLPAPNAFVPAFRRLDGFLVTGMVWLLLAGVLLGSAR